ncbi:hypothetical protein CFC21_044718 [Triticum aestivum]|uniref:Cytochrome P450 n=2 Tax=Triticum aestivum TaxID=4565 RepID=A0A9R1FSF1_WHEAT|nr:hypothetical protein CFC21_044718 [Triticum aestivum]
MDNTAVASYSVPRGSQVVLSRIGLGRNPRVWAGPLGFWPERHLAGDDATVALSEPELRFVSFSTGRRGCPGIAPGTLFTVMLFARLLQRFTWSLPPGVDGVCPRSSPTWDSTRSRSSFESEADEPVKLLESWRSASAWS